MDKTQVNGRLLIVGAGPGDPELITIKGIKAIEQADIVLHDGQRSPALLNYVRDGCKVVNLSKGANDPSRSHYETNQLIAFYTKQYKTVVYLVNGDPGTLGWNRQEWELLLNSKVSVEVIPGISTAIAAPCSFRIPLTKRGVSESFLVVAGSSHSNFFNTLSLAAQSSATVIIVNGMNYLHQIRKEFHSVRGEHEPLAIVLGATQFDQKILHGTIGTLDYLVTERRVDKSAVVIIGKVINEGMAIDKLKSVKNEYCLSL